MQLSPSEARTQVILGPATPGIGYKGEQKLQLSASETRAGLFWSPHNEAHLSVPRTLRQCPPKWQKWCLSQVDGCPDVAECRAGSSLVPQSWEKVINPPLDSMHYKYPPPALLLPSSGVLFCTLSAALSQRPGRLTYPAPSTAAPELEGKYGISGPPCFEGALAYGTLHAIAPWGSQTGPWD